MSLFSWLFPAKKSQSPTSGLSRVQPQRSAAQAAGRKGERMAHRELLYAVVRQAMIRAGVLSSGYKFKVLSLDAKGHQFLVMIDLARAFGGDPGRLADIEATIVQAAKARHDLVVDGVYWRMNEHVAVGDPAAPENTALPAEISRPAVLESPPGPLESAASRSAPRFEPIQADEVAAFKSALAAGVSGPAAMAAASPANSGATARAFDGSVKHGPQNYMLLTGFEDTELPDGRAPVLSGTQYGELN